MVARAACDDVHAVDEIELLGCHVELVDLEPTAHEASGERIADDARLLVNLLEHEVGISALLGNVHVPRDMGRCELDFPTVVVEERNGVRRQAGDLTVVEIHHVTRGADDGNCIGGDVGSIRCRAHDDGHVTARDHDDTRLVHAGHGETV